MAIALIEIGMDKLDAIRLIRTKRKGALNIEQNTKLMDYKKIGMKAKKNDACCFIF